MPPVVIGAGARVRAGAVLGPHVSVGRHADVGRGAQLADTVLLLERAQVPDGRQGRGPIIGQTQTIDVAVHRSGLGVGVVRPAGVGGRRC